MMGNNLEIMEIKKNPNALEPTKNIKNFPPMYRGNLLATNNIPIANPSISGTQGGIIVGDGPGPVNKTGLPAVVGNNPNIPNTNNNNNTNTNNAVAVSGGGVETAAVDNDEDIIFLPQKNYNFISGRN